MPHRLPSTDHGAHVSTYVEDAAVDGDVHVSTGVNVAAVGRHTQASTGDNVAAVDSRAQVSPGVNVARAIAARAQLIPAPASRRDCAKRET